MGFDMTYGMVMMTQIYQREDIMGGGGGGGFVCQK